MTGDALITSRQGAVFVITLHRPRVLNAIDFATAVQLAAAVDEFDSDETLFAAVLTGGPTVFCAGADIKSRSCGDPGPYAGGRGFAGFVQRPPVKPIVAAVEGWALGGGLEIALACDFIIASETATFGFPEVKLGLTAGGGGTIHTPQVIPRGIAMEMLLTGEPIDAHEAHRVGLVNRVTETGRALEVALGRAQVIATGSPIAASAIKQVARQSVGLTIEEAFRSQAPVFEPVQDSQDSARRVTEFGRRRQ
jgi:enoyl-CoA hydratase